MSKSHEVVVIMGGLSAEREISLISGQNVLASLQKNGVDAYGFDLQRDNITDLFRLNAKKAFLTTHGRYGEDGSLQGLLELAGLAYTGSKVSASSLAFNKHLTKQIWSNYNIPVASSQYLEKSSYVGQNFKLEVSLPVIVKPCCEGSSLGLSRVYDYKDLAVAIELAFKQDQRILIEELIIGLEYSITIYNGKPYPIIQIEAPDGNYNYHNKYFSDLTKYHISPISIVSKQAEIEKYAVLAYNSIGSCGLARIDLMLDQNNNFYFLEINTLPGMTTHSLAPMSFNAAGINYDQLCLKILADARLG